MAEIYLYHLVNSEPCFTPSNAEISASLLAAQPNLINLPKDIEIFARMGDPDLIHCIIFRHKNKPGGIFVLHDRAELLFAAIAENNLAFAIGCSYFGEMTSNTRYGVDIHEEFEEPND